MTPDVKTQFGPGAVDYATSAVHAAGKSLARLVALTRPQPDWQVLDVATGAGHTALAFAPYAAQVIASDITPEMLTQTRLLAQERGLIHLETSFAAADALPFENGRFHLVTCRLAAHHFPSISHFLTEAARVLHPGGLLAIADTIVPGSRLRGKKAALQRQSGRYVNAFEKLRDPSHRRCLSRPEWEDNITAAGFSILHQEALPLWLDLDAYAARMRVTAVNRLRLRVMLRQAPAPVQAFLTPHPTGDKIAFRFTEGIFVGRLEAGSLDR